MAAAVSDFVHNKILHGSRAKSVSKSYCLVNIIYRLVYAMRLRKTFQLKKLELAHFRLCGKVVVKLWLENSSYTHVTNMVFHMHMHHILSLSLVKFLFEAPKA